MTKEALKLALEALEDLGMKHYESTGEVLYKETFATIKEALANEALEKKAENARELGLNYEPEQEPCGGCGGSGWVPHDPDIGTSQECFVCGGSGAYPKEPEPYKVISDHITQTTGGRAYVDPVTGNVSVGTVAQPSVSVEQEPVAWYVERQHAGFRDHGLKCGPFWKLSEAEEWTDSCHILKELYTTPPQRKPLTYEELGKLVSATPWRQDESMHTYAVRACRAIEAAHGIKENT